MFEHAVNATRRVLEVMSGRSASSCRPTAYVLFGYAGSGVAGQSFVSAPLRAARRFHGPAFAVLYNRDVRDSSTNGVQCEYRAISNAVR